jgi:5-methyltetrahydropteroyltriglutamate--homocysteine methyltransferase
MRRSEGRILTTHAGSLHRPRPLVDMYLERAAKGAIDEGALDEAVRDAVIGVVARQQSVGIDVGNNGEQDREIYNLYLRWRLDGLGGSWERAARAEYRKYPEHAASVTPAKEQYAAFGGTPCAVGPIVYRDTIPIEQECDLFESALTAASGEFAEAFLTAPTPGTVAVAVKNEYYDTDEAYFAALGEALRIEYEAIAARGWILQLDATELAMERHYGYMDRPLNEFLDLAELAVATINNAVQNIPPEQIRLHVCWGNYHGPHDCDVPLGDIWPIVKNTNVGAFMLTGANPRHQHEVDVLAASPMRNDQILVAGVIDPMTNFIEHPEVVARRIEQAARAMGDPSRVIAGTDCGFETGVGVSYITSDIAWAKLAVLVEGAKLASERLF